MDKFKERLQALRREQGFSSMDEFADHIKMKRATYRSYETGAREPKSDTLLNLARIFNVSLDYLLGLTNERTSLNPEFSIRTFDEENLLYLFRQLDESGKQEVLRFLDWVVSFTESKPASRIEEDDDFDISSLYLTFPFYPDRPSAGTGSHMYDEQSPFTVQVKETPVSKRADFVLQVEGNSMEPKFSNDDFVLIKKQDVVENGEIGIFLYDGQVYIKQLKDDLLHSLNPEYDDIQIDGEIVCFGKVLGKAEL